MTTKRDQLRARTRQSIDPDAMEGAPAPRPAALRTVEAHAAPMPAPAPTEASEVVVDAKPTEATPKEQEGGRRTAPEASPVKSSNPADWRTALDDPSITEDGREYTSFYVPKMLKARYAAAIYWTSRHPKAAGKVPLSMSADIAAHMESMADDLESQFNDGDVFPPTPEQIKAAKKRKPSK